MTWMRSNGTMDRAAAAAIVRERSRNGKLDESSLRGFERAGLLRAHHHGRRRLPTVYSASDVLAASIVASLRRAHFTPREIKRFLLSVVAAALEGDT